MKLPWLVSLQQILHQKVHFPQLPVSLYTNDASHIDEETESHVDLHLTLSFVWSESTKALRMIGFPLGSGALSGIASLTSPEKFVQSA